MPFKDDGHAIEPIDVLVDVIIGFLEKGTAFTRAAGNESFSLLSGLVKDSTINLILSVRDGAVESSSVINLVHSNWNIGTLRNLLILIRIRPFSRTTLRRLAMITQASRRLRMKIIKLSGAMRQKMNVWRRRQLVS